MGKKRWHREAEQDREALWPLSADERYISVDIEADGPVPGLHSMLSLGAAAYNAWGQRVGKFSANLDALPDATTDDRTMAWWQTQFEAWKRARERPRGPKTVMEEFHLFALGEGPKRSGRPVMVAYAHQVLRSILVIKQRFAQLHNDREPPYPATGHPSPTPRRPHRKVRGGRPGITLWSPRFG